MEDQHLVPSRLEPLARRGDAWRRDAEHRCGDQRTVSRVRLQRPRSPSRQIAPAALARMRRDSGFSPAMSTTEYIIVMSFTSTYGAVLPDAIVDTMTLGTPTGSSRIGGGDHRRAAAAAESEHAVETPGGECLTSECACTSQHDVDRLRRDRRAREGPPATIRLRRDFARR